MEIITREAAIDLKLKKYFTGKPCKRGHIEERFTCNAVCIICRKLRNCTTRNPIAEKSERSIAREKGIGKYFTGLPCTRGHIAERFTSNAVCTECNRLNVGNRSIAEAKYNKKRQELRAEQLADQKSVKSSNIGAYFVAGRVQSGQGKNPNLIEIMKRARARS